MKLRNWQIEGFGCFRDCALPPPGLGNGLNLVIGPNEAGKSTLLDFIRYTLFDYPDGRSSKPRREPLRGGTHGGAIDYEDATGVYRVSRWRRRNDSLRLVSSDGTIHPEGLLAAQTGHVSAEVYRNVFGFSLSELQALESLRQEEIVNLLFSAAIGESAARINRVRQQLQERSETIFRERARARAENAPTVIRLQAELNEIESRLAEARERAVGAAGRRGELDAARADAVRLKKEAERLAGRLAELDRLMQGWAPFVRLCQTNAAVARAGDFSRYPAGGREQWQDLKNRVATAAETVAECRAEERNLAESLAAMPNRFSLPPRLPEAERLHEERAAYEAACRLAADAGKQLAESERRWQVLQEELGPGWGEQTVLDFDRSLLAEDEARRRLEPWTRARQALQGAEDRCAHLQEEAGDAGDPEWTLDRIEAERTWLGGLRDAAAERDRKQAECRALESEVHQVEVALTAAAPVLPARQPVQPAAWSAGAAGLGLAASALLFFAGEAGGGLASLLFAVLLGGLALLLRAPVFAPSAADGSQLARLAEEKKGRRDSARRSLEEFDRAWTATAAERNLSWPAREVEMVGLEEVLARRQRQALARAGVAAARDEVVRRREELKPLEAAWREFLARRNLPESLAPETALTILNKLRTAGSLLAERRKVQDRLQAEEALAGRYLERLARFLAECGREPPSREPAAVMAGFAGLRQEIERECEEQRKREGIEERRREAALKLTQREEALAAAEAARDKFLRTAGCTDEAEFLRLAEKVEELGRLKQQAEAASDTLAAVFGRGGAPEELQQAWESGGRPDWESERARLASEREEAVTSREECIRLIATIEEELRRELGSGEVAELQAEGEALRAEIEAGLDEWLELQAALHLLRETRARFEKDHQPPALAEASRLFERVTGGTWRQILMPLDSTELVAVTAEGAQRPVEQLSRGTLEQLFLCVRLGYIRHFQLQRKVHLPLLMDDVAVNFDPARMRRVFAILEEFAGQGQQILFFTCHPGLARWLNERARCIEIRDFRFHLRGSPDPAPPAEAEV